MILLSCPPCRKRSILIKTCVDAQILVEKQHNSDDCWSKRLFITYSSVFLSHPQIPDLQEAEVQGGLQDGDRDGVEVLPRLLWRRLP